MLRLAVRHGGLRECSGLGEPRPEQDGGTPPPEDGGDRGLDQIPQVRGRYRSRPVVLQRTWLVPSAEWDLLQGDVRRVPLGARDLHGRKQTTLSPFDRLPPQADSFRHRPTGRGGEGGSRGGDAADRNAWHVCAFTIAERQTARGASCRLPWHRLRGRQVRIAYPTAGEPLMKPRSLLARGMRAHTPMNAAFTIAEARTLPHLARGTLDRGRAPRTGRPDGPARGTARTDRP